MLRKCNICDKEFVAYPSEIKSGNAKYCSRVCMGKAKYKQLTRKCVLCKKEFSFYPSENNRIYCSTLCYQQRNGKKQTLKCRVCGKDFIATPHAIKTGGGKYCSRKCYRHIQSSRRSWNANPIMKKCLVCGKSFYTWLAKIKIGKGKFCSKECYLKDHSKDAWTETVCCVCGKKFRSLVYQRRKCCSHSCSAMVKWKDNRERWKKWSETNLNTMDFFMSLRKKIRRLSVYDKWRTRILVRDGLKCTNCRSRNNLEVDHVVSFISVLRDNNITTIIDAINCEALWNDDNGRTLCRSCHILTANYGYKAAL